MSHEVVKTVGGRRYRYRVENYRDAETGKVRGRWTYLGRVGEPPGDADAEPPAPARRDASRTRSRLLEALSALLERSTFDAITAGAISAEAGLAHGTFYRHFADKAAALEALFADFRASIERSRPPLDGPLRDLPGERARVRAWLAAIFDGALERPGLLRAYYVYSAQNASVRAQKLARRLGLRESLERYFDALNAAGYASIGDPREVAAALLAIIDGTLHVAALEDRPFDPLTVAGAAAVFERAIFGRVPADDSSAEVEAAGVSAPQPG